MVRWLPSIRVHIAALRTLAPTPLVPQEIGFAGKVLPPSFEAAGAVCPYRWMHSSGSVGLR